MTKEVIILAADKVGIIDQFKESGILPDYCTYNWDSFEECFQEMAENLDSPVRIVSLISQDSKDVDIYREIVGGTESPLLEISFVNSLDK